MIKYFEAIKILKSMEATAVTDRLKNEALEIAINAINEVSTKKEYTTEMLDRYISVKELKKQLNTWNMGLELPRWSLRVIEETLSAKLSLEEEGSTN